MTPVDRQDLVERDLQAHSKSITELTARFASYETAQAVKEVEDEYLEKRLQAIERKLDGIHRLGWWVLAAFGGSFIALVANFVFKGGLYLAK